MSEKAIEIFQDDNGVILSIRPPFPFEAEGFRISGGFLNVFGEGKLIALSVPQDQMTALLAADSLSLIEFPEVGESPDRELILSRSR